jgi:hypothetical protein
VIQRLAPKLIAPLVNDHPSFEAYAYNHHLAMAEQG